MRTFMRVIGIVIVWYAVGIAISFAVVAMGLGVKWYVSDLDRVAVTLGTLAWVFLGLMFFETPAKMIDKIFDWASRWVEPLEIRWQEKRKRKEVDALAARFLRKGPK